MKKKKTVRTPKATYTQLRNPGQAAMLNLWTHGGQYHNPPETMPSEVTVYGQKYRVYYHSRIYAAKKKSQRLLGMVIFSHRVIFIEPGQAIHAMREALYHEIAHIYAYVWQTKSEAMSKLTYQQVEDICDMFGEAVPDLVSNNRLSI